MGSKLKIDRHRFDEGCFITLMGLPFYARLWYNLAYHTNANNVRAVQMAIIRRFTFEIIARQMQVVDIKLLTKPSTISLSEFSSTTNAMLSFCTKDMIDEMINSLSQHLQFTGYPEMAADLSKYLMEREKERDVLEIIITQPEYFRVAK